MVDPTYPNLFGDPGMHPSTKAKQRTWMDYLIQRKVTTLDELQRFLMQLPLMDMETITMKLQALLGEEQGMLQAMRTMRAELHNHGPRTRAPATSEPFDDEKKAEIITVTIANPTLPQHEVAKITNVNQGRVNNALHGVRQ